jgi:hypothetical protein
MEKWDEWELSGGSWEMGRGFFACVSAQRRTADESDGLEST